MYILLNIKDSEKAAEAISLLIRNNFLSMVTGQELREVCSDCAQRRDAPSESHSVSPGPSQPSSKSISYQAITSRKRKTSPPPTHQQIFETKSLFTCKDEQLDGGINITELETTLTVPDNSGDTSFTKLKRQPKRKPAEAREGKQVLHCMICSGIITFGGSTPMANIERHIKLHASREQFSCSICSQQHTRRYEVRKHIEQHHPFDLDHAEIIDHEQELRSEYDSLWVKCFPEADFADYKNRKKNYFLPPASNFHSAKPFE